MFCFCFVAAAIMFCFILSFTARYLFIFLFLQLKCVIFFLYLSYKQLWWVFIFCFVFVFAVSRINTHDDDDGGDDDDDDVKFLILSYADVLTIRSYLVLNTTLRLHYDAIMMTLNARWAWTDIFLYRLQKKKANKKNLLQIADFPYKSTTLCICYNLK